VTISRCMSKENKFSINL